MKLDEVTDNVPGQTVRAMDVLFPGIGEIIGGSQREDNYEKLAQRCQEVGIPNRIYLVVFRNSSVWYSTTRWFRYWFRTFGDVCNGYDQYP
jgi:asparaginyl-tRNA synthetase